MRQSSRRPPVILSGLIWVRTSTVPLSSPTAASVETQSESVAATTWSSAPKWSTICDRQVEQMWRSDEAATLARRRSWSAWSRKLSTRFK
uniref:Putative secreted protein n=1 Tax=Ixodes ricinus TaxID=34613 RepID=A0A6B0UA61_IXORI